MNNWEDFLNFCSPNPSCEFYSLVQINFSENLQYSQFKRCY